MILWIIDRCMTKQQDLKDSLKVKYKHVTYSRLILCSQCPTLRGSHTSKIMFFLRQLWRYHIHHAAFSLFFAQVLNQLVITGLYTHKVSYLITPLDYFIFLKTPLNLSFFILVIKNKDAGTKGRDK